MRIPIEPQSSSFVAKYSVLVTTIGYDFGHAHQGAEVSFTVVLVKLEGVCCRLRHYKYLPNCFQPTRNYLCANIRVGQEIATNIAFCSVLFGVAFLTVSYA